MNEGAHPAAALEPVMNTARSRAKFAIVALGGTALLRLYAIAVTLWQNSLLTETKLARADGREIPMDALRTSDSLIATASTLSLVLLVVTATCFILWLRTTIRLTRGLGAHLLQWKENDAFSAFVVPFANFIRPYEVIRDVNEGLNPGLVPVPIARVSNDQGPAYRGLEVKEPPPPAPIPALFLGAWWAAFWIGNVMARIASVMDADHSPGIDALQSRNMLWSVANVVQIASAVLAVLVVRSVAARLEERFRRVRHNSVEELKAAGIVIEGTADARPWTM